MGFDLETTGVDPQSARIVSAAIVYHEADDRVAERSRTWLVNPGVPIPAGATAVHGITTEHAHAHGMPSSVAVAEIADELQRAWSVGHPVIVFNATYDLTLLNADLIRHGHQPIHERDGWNEAHIVDPLVIDRALDRYRRGKRTLQVMTEHYGVVATDAHSADGDAVATCRLARAIVAQYPTLRTVLASDLRSQQQTWCSEWATRFQAYLRSQGRADAVIDGTWPLQIA